MTSLSWAFLGFLADFIIFSLLLRLCLGPYELVCWGAGVSERPRPGTACRGLLDRPRGGLGPGSWWQAGQRRRRRRRRTKGALTTARAFGPGE